MPEVSAVVITCNSEQYIGPCLDSLAHQEFRDFEIIVVDNGSVDGTVRLIEEQYPSVTLIKNGRNEGASRARNQGIEQSLGEWILTLDCDIVLEKNFLSAIMDCVGRSSSQTGALQPKVFDAGGTRIYSFGICLTSAARFHDRGRGKYDSGQFEATEHIFGACCAAALYRKKALEDIREKTGFFDERFFFLVEDVDLSWRMGHKGWKTAFVPSAVCFHAGNSSGFNRQQRQFLCWRNRKLFMAKNGLTSGMSRVWYDFPRLVWMSLTNSFFQKRIFGGRIIRTKKDVWDYD